MTSEAFTSLFGCPGLEIILALKYHFHAFSSAPTNKRFCSNKSNAIFFSCILKKDEKTFRFQIPKSLTRPLESHQRYEISTIYALRGGGGGQHSTMAGTHASVPSDYNFSGGKNCKG